MLTEQEKEIIEKLKNVLYYDVPEITQDSFDNMIDYIIKNEIEGIKPKELIWRLSICNEKLNLKKVIDIYIDSKDSYYISELVAFIDGNLDQEYLIEKMISTNDITFINKALSKSGHSMLKSLEEKYLKKLQAFYNKIGDE